MQCSGKILKLSKISKPIQQNQKAKSAKSGHPQILLSRVWVSLCFLVFSIIRLSVYPDASPDFTASTDSDSQNY